jgi:hypothetical protein
MQTFAILRFANTMRNTDATTLLLEDACVPIWRNLHGRSVTYSAILDFRAGVRNETSL